MKALQPDKKTKKNLPPSKPVRPAEDKKKSIGISARDGSKLQALIRVAAKHGVSSLRVGDMEVHFGPAPVSGAIFAPGRDLDDLRAQEVEILPDGPEVPVDAHGFDTELRATTNSYNRWRDKPPASETNPFE